MSPSPSRTLHAALDVALGALATGLVLGRVPTTTWPVELVGNFVVQATLASLVLTGVYSFRGQGNRASIALFVTLLWALPWAAQGLQSAPSAAPGPSWTLSLHNVLRTNATPGAVIDEVEAWDADLIVLEEVSAAWQAPVERLHTRWPHGVFEPADHNFGIAARSKQPLSHVSVERMVGPPAATLPALHLEAHTPIGPITVWAVHLVPPISAAAARVRDDQIAALVDVLNDGPLERTVVVGDLNTTGFAETHRRLLRDTDLIDARRGHGLLPTWPSPLPGPLRLGLDHVLTSSDLAVRSIEVGGSTGSDHRGLRVELAPVQTESP